MVVESSFLGLLNLVESTCWLFYGARKFSREGRFVGILLWDVVVCLRLGFCRVL